MNAVKQFVKNPNYYRELQTDLADTLVNMIASEDAVWRKGWRPNPNERYIPINAISKKEYKGMNIWLLWGKSSSNIWCTFLGWKKLGYQITKGSKGSKVHFFEPKKNLKIVDGVVQTDKNGDDEYYMSFLFKSYTVFSAEQVQTRDGKGYPIPTAEDTSHLDNSIKPIQKCKKFFDNLNAKLIYDGGKCFYRPSTDEIGMPKIEQFENAEEYYSVFAHEHLHWTASRLKRNKVSYAEEELVAEVGAFLTCVHLGIQSTPKPNNLAYLKHWSNGDINKKKIFSALSDASKGLEYLKELQTKKEKKVA